MPLNNGPYLLPFRGPGVLSWCQPQLSFSPFWALLRHLGRALILSQKPDSFGRSHVSAQAPSDSCGPWPGPTDIQCSLSQAVACSCQKSPLPLRVSFSWCRSLWPWVSCQFLAHLMKGFGRRKLESMGSFYFWTSVNSTNQFNEFRLSYFHAWCSLYPALNPTENASYYLQLMKNVALFSWFEHTPKHWPERSV